MNKRLASYLLIGIAFAAAGLWVGSRHNPAPEPLTTQVPPTPTGQPHGPVAQLFQQTMNDADGKPQALSQWQGKTLIINFWATWCTPCVEEMPELEALSKEHAGHGVQVLGIGIDSPSNIATFRQKVKVSYPLFAAGMSGTDLARDFGNKTGGLPFTVLVGADGQVKKTYLGRLKFELLKADLAAL
jgi:thiol-disulfide isomerase/thioredoxin